MFEHLISYDVTLGFRDGSVSSFVVRAISDVQACDSARTWLRLRPDALDICVFRGSRLIARFTC